MLDLDMIRDEAEEVLRRTVGISIPVDVQHIASLCGLEIERWSTCPAWLSGFLQRGTWGSTIVVNANHSTTRRRYTIAHELCHWLHRDPGVTQFCVDGDELDDTERIANAFAAELLMPADLVYREFPRASSFRALCETFRVSRLAMGYRLNDLGLDFRAE